VTENAGQYFLSQQCANNESRAYQPPYHDMSESGISSRQRYQSFRIPSANVFDNEY
jgi:hypothetical protein